MTAPSPIPNISNVFNEDLYISMGLTKEIADEYYINKNNLINVNNGLILNSDIMSNNLSISPQEISYLDNVTSNIQIQINNIAQGGANSVGIITPLNLAISNNDTFNTAFNKTQGLINNLISNTPANVVDLNSIQTLTNKTLTTPKIISLKTLSNNNLLIPDINDTITTNTQLTSIYSTISTINDNVFTLNAKVDNLPVSFGSGDVSYLSNSNIVLNGITYKTLSKTSPNSSEATLTLTISSSSGNVLLGSFISDYNINKTFIDSGIYEFNLFASISDLVGVTKIYATLSKITTSFVKTTLFTLNNSLDIQSQPVNLYSFQATQAQINNINIDDKLIVDFYCNTTHTNVLVTLYFNSSSYFSHIHIPLITNHDNLSGLNVGEYLHLSNNQKNNIINESSAILNGYLSSTKFIEFNNKEPLINKNTAFNKNYSTTLSDIKMNGNQSLGILDTLCKTDHIHPIDTSREAAFNSGTIDLYFRGDKTFQTLSKTTIGLSNCDNTTDLLKPISTATQTAINDLFNKFYQVIYIAGSFGLDSNNGYVLNKPKKTIQNGLDDINSNTGANLIILPSVYNEVITISRLNITISSIAYEKGGLVSITNDINITSVSSSIRLSGLSMINLNITGNCSVYIDNSKISGILSKTGTGYLEINNSALSGQINLNSNSTSNFISNNISGLISNNSGYNTSTNYFTNNLVNGVNLNLVSGIWSFSNSVIYATSSSVNAISSYVSSFVYLNNLSIVNANDNSAAKVSLLGFWSINNVNYNRASSVLTGTNLQRTYDFDKLNVVNSINNVTALLLSYIDPTSSILTLLNSKISNNTANTFTNINTFSNILEITGFLRVNTSINITTNQIEYLKNLTSDILTLLNSKIDLSSDSIFTGSITFNKPLKNGSYILNRYNLAIGTGSFNNQTINNTSTNNTALGVNSMYNLLNGINNCALGSNSLYSITNTNDNIAIGNNSSYNLSNGTGNISLGVDSLLNSTSANYNVAIGYSSGSNNLMGSYNTFVGANSNFLNNQQSYNRSTAIGYGSSISGSNQISIGTSLETTLFNGSVLFGSTNPVYTGALISTAIAGNSKNVVSTINNQTIQTFRTTSNNVMANATVQVIVTFPTAYAINQIPYVFVLVGNSSNSVNEKMTVSVGSINNTNFTYRLTSFSGVGLSYTLDVMSIALV